jgi:ribosome-binding factor A
MAGGRRSDEKKSGGGFNPKGGSKDSPKDGPKDNHRVPRVEKQIREVIGRYLIGGFRGDVDGIISVTRVIASRDIRTAKVLVTLMGLGDGQAPAKKAAIKELNAHAHEFQREVNHRLQMKFCPKVTFFYDEGFENAMKVENILRDISKKRAQDEAAPASPSEVSDDE